MTFTPMPPSEYRALAWALAEAAEAKDMDTYDHLKQKWDDYQAAARAFHNGLEPSKGE